MTSKYRILAMMLALACCIMAFSFPAGAVDGYYSNEDGENTTPLPADQIHVSTEAVQQPSGNGGEPGVSWDINTEEIDTILSGFLSLLGSSALTPSGNMTLVDDILQDESYVVQDKKVVKDKQFITVQTKNGNYFYIIIDRSGETENVYFLNLVDEADLLALLDEDEVPVKQEECICQDKCHIGEINASCPVCRVNLSECLGKEAVKQEPVQETREEEPKTETEPVKTNESKRSPFAPMLIVLILLAAGGAVYWFIIRKKPDTKGKADLDNYDYGEEDEEYETEEETAEENEKGE